MGSLLSRYESFIWEDVNKNRSNDLQNYNYAIGSARSKSDLLFRPSKIFDGDVPSNIFYVMYFEGKMSYDDLKSLYNWLTVDDFQVLMTMGNIIGNPTEQHSNTWNEFSNEFTGKHISLIGLQDETCTDPLVFCKVTHSKFHSDYIASLVPKLKLEPNLISRRIEAKQLPTSIERLDVPQLDASGVPVHGQQIHIHLRLKGQKCALNLDGTWKHALPKDSTIKIPSAICEILSSFGFKIPDEYYE